MRRTRKDATKVWHNPDLDTFSKRGGGGGGSGGVVRVATETAEDKRHAKQHRAALEALFAPKREPEPDDARAKNGAAAKTAGRIVLAPAPQADPRTAERQKLLHRLLNAEGRPSVTKAADAFLAAGFTFPEEQDVYLQLLEHVREEHVRGALGRLESILAGELPKRRAVLESRLRRIEQFAEDGETRDAAARLRRRVSGRAVADPPKAAAPSQPIVARAEALAAVVTDGEAIVTTSEVVVTSSEVVVTSSEVVVAAAEVVEVAASTPSAPAPADPG